MLHILQIDEITEAEPTSVTLRFCKRKVSIPFKIYFPSSGMELNF